MAFYAKALKQCSMKLLLLLLSVSSTYLLGHAGHPGPEAHGDPTHLLLGIAVAFPVLLLAGFVGVKVRKRATVKVSKED